MQRVVRNKKHMKHASDRFCHDVPEYQPQCSLETVLWTFTGGMNAVPPKDKPSFGARMVVVKESAVSCVILNVLQAFNSHKM